MTTFEELQKQSLCGGYDVIVLHPMNMARVLSEVREQYRHLMTAPPEDQP